jgi:HSP20 family molecular chaperone IbpA
VVEVELAGILESDIDVTLSGSMLWIRADRPPAKGSSLVHEIPRGFLSRRVELPHPVELANVAFEEGLLTLVLRRRAEAP